MTQLRLPENLVPFDEAWRLAKVPGNPPSFPTRSRWTTTGVKGKVLRTMLIRGRVHCTPEWLIEFFEAVTLAKRESVKA